MKTKAPTFLILDLTIYSVYTIYIYFYVAVVLDWFQGSLFCTGQVNEKNKMQTTNYKNLTYITQAHNPFYDLSFFIYTYVYQMDKDISSFIFSFLQYRIHQHLYIQVLIYRLPSFSHSFTLFSRILANRFLWSSFFYMLMHYNSIFTHSIFI